MRALLGRSRVKDVDAVLDTSLIKAWSTRRPDESRVDLSDADARVGRSGRSYGLGYKLHISVDHRRILPLASVLTLANESEKKHGLTLVERIKMVLRNAVAILRSLIADSKYSSGRMRRLVEDTVIS